MNNLELSKKGLRYWGVIILLSILVVISLTQKWDFLWSTGLLLIITIYSISFNVKNKDSSNWPFTLIIAGYTVLMIGLLINNLTNNLELLVWIFLFVVLGFVSMALVITSYNFMKSKKMISILFNYLLIALLLIGLFAGIYAFSDDIYYQGEPLSMQESNGFDYFYFSGLNFYLNGDYNFSPMKISRIWVLIQIFTSFALHGIILQEILSRRKK